MRFLLLLCVLTTPVFGQLNIPATAYTGKFMTNRTAAEARDYLGISSGGGTNEVTRSGTNVFTGTNTFNGRLVTTNANFIREVVLFKGPPNVLTNVTGGYGNSNLFHTQLIPGGILGTNGSLVMYQDTRLVAVAMMAATTTRGWTAHYNVGTNIITRFQFGSSSTVATNQVTAFGAQILLKNTGTQTNNFTGLNQIEGQPLGSGATSQNGTLAMDTSVDWTLALYGNVGTAGLETNEWRNLTISIRYIE